MTQGDPGSERIEPLEVGSLIEFKEKTWDPGPHRERMRGYLAMSLVAILALVILASFAMIWPTRNDTLPQANASQQVSAQQNAGYAYVAQDQQGTPGSPGEGATVPPQTLPQGTSVASETPLEELLTLIFTPIIGLVGAVVGFYYGGESAKARNDQQ